MVSSTSEVVDERSSSTIGSRRVRLAYVMFFTENCASDYPIMESDSVREVVRFRNSNFRQF